MVSLNYMNSNVIMNLNSIIILITIFNLTFLNAQEPADPDNTVKECIKMTEKIRLAGDGSTPGSCMGCNPALPKCHKDCQQKIDRLYIRCDGICLPDGYYHDPLSTITGCWNGVKPEIKIAVERCGCDSAPRSLHMTSVVTVLIISAFTALAMGWF